MLSRRQSAEPAASCLHHPLSVEGRPVRGEGSPFSTASCDFGLSGVESGCAGGSGPLLEMRVRRKAVRKSPPEHACTGPFLTRNL